MAVEIPPKASMSNVPALVPQGAHAGSPPLMLKRPATVVGGDSHSHLHLISSTVSKQHALIINSPQGAYVRDLGSRTHVIVNDKAVLESWLADGDKVQIGKFLFKFVAPKTPTTPRTDAPKAVLDIQDSPMPVPVEGKVVLIGRRSASDIPLLESSVSSRHAVIFEANGRRYLRDLYSRTGTFLNGSKIHQEELRIGDQIRIGETDIQIKAAPTESATMEEIDQEVGMALGEAPATSADPLSPISQSILKAPPAVKPQPVGTGDEIDLDSDPDVSDAPDTTAVLDAVAELPAIPAQLPPSPSTGDSISDLLAAKPESASDAPIADETIPPEPAKAEEAELPRHGWRSATPPAIPMEPEPVEPAAAVTPPPLPAQEPTDIEDTVAPVELDVEEFAVDHTPPPPVEIEATTWPVEVDEVEPEVSIAPQPAVEAIDQTPLAIEPEPLSVANEVQVPAPAIELPEEIAPVEPEAILAPEPQPEIQPEIAEAPIEIPVPVEIEPEIEATIQPVEIPPELPISIETVDEAPAIAEPIEIAPPELDIPSAATTDAASVAEEPPALSAIPELSPGAVESIIDEAISDKTPAKRGRKPGRKPVEKKPAAEKKKPAPRGRKPKTKITDEPPVDVVAGEVVQPVADEILATVDSAVVEAISETSVVVPEPEIVEPSEPAPPEISVTAAPLQEQSVADFVADAPPVLPAETAPEIEPDEAPVASTELDQVDFSDLEVQPAAPVPTDDEPALDAPPLDLVALEPEPQTAEAPAQPSQEAQVFEAVLRHEPQAGPKLGIEPAIVGLQVRPEDFVATTAPQHLPAEAEIASSLADTIIPEPPADEPALDAAHDDQEIVPEELPAEAVAEITPDAPADEPLEIPPLQESIEEPQEAPPVDAQITEPEPEPLNFATTPQAVMDDNVSMSSTAVVTPSVFDEVVVGGNEPQEEPSIEVSSVNEAPPTAAASDEDFAAMVEEFSSPSVAPLGHEPLVEPEDDAELLVDEQVTPQETADLGIAADAPAIASEENLGPAPLQIDELPIESAELDAPLPPPFTFKETAAQPATVAPRQAPRPNIAPARSNEPFSLDDGFFKTDLTASGVKVRGDFAGARPAAPPLPPGTNATMDASAVSPNLVDATRDLAAPPPPLSQSPAPSQPSGLGFGGSFGGGVSTLNFDHFLGGLPVNLPRLPGAPSTFGKVGVSFDGGRKPAIPIPEPAQPQSFIQPPPSPQPAQPVARQAPPPPPQASVYPKPLTDDTVDAPPAPRQVITTPPAAYGRRKPLAKPLGKPIPFASDPMAPPADDVEIHDLSEAIPAFDPLGSPAARKASTAFDGLAMPPLEARDPFSLSPSPMHHDAVFGGTASTGTSAAFVPDSPELAARREKTVDHDFADDDFWNRTDDQDVELPPVPATPAPQEAPADETQDAAPAVEDNAEMHPPDDGDAVTEAERVGLQQADVVQESQEPAARQPRALRGSGRPPVMPDQPEPAKKRRKRSFFGFLSLIMIFCMGATLTAIWLSPVPSKTSAVVTFKDVNIDNTSASDRFVSTQRHILGDNQTRLAAITNFKITRPDLDAGFLANVPDFSKVTDMAYFSDSANVDGHWQTPLNLNYSGKDASGDRLRMAAMAQAIIAASGPEMEKDRIAHDRAQTAIADLEKANAQKAELVSQIDAKKQLADNAPTQTELDHLLGLSKDLAAAVSNVSAAVDREKEALQKLQSATPGDASATATTRPGADDQLDQLYKQIGDLSRQLAEANRSEPAQTLDARKKLEAADSELTDQLAAASTSLDGGSKLKTFVDSARQTQAKARELTTRLIADGEDFQKQLEGIQTRITEQTTQQQQQKWADDPALKELNESLQIAQHKYNAAAGGGLNDPQTLASYQKDVDRYNDAIKQRQTELKLDPADLAISQLINDLIHSQRQKLEKEKSDIDAVLDPLARSFDESIAGINDMPAEQKDLAKKIQERLSAQTAARAEYAAATSGGKSTDDLQKQIDQLKSLAAARQQEIALAAARQKLDQDTKTLADAQTQAKKAKQASDAAQQQFDDARAVRAQIETLTASLAQIDQKLPQLASVRDRADLDDVHRFEIIPFHPESVQSKPIDQRMHYSIWSTGVILALFTLIAIGSSSRSGAAAAPNELMRPLPIESVQDFPGADHFNNPSQNHPQSHQNDRPALTI